MLSATMKQGLYGCFQNFFIQSQKRPKLTQTGLPMKKSVSERARSLLISKKKPPHQNNRVSSVFFFKIFSKNSDSLESIWSVNILQNMGVAST